MFRDLVGISICFLPHTELYFIFIILISENSETYYKIVCGKRWVFGDMKQFSRSSPEGLSARLPRASSLLIGLLLTGCSGGPATYLQGVIMAPALGLPGGGALENVRVLWENGRGLDWEKAQTPGQSVDPLVPTWLPLSH